ncbi:MAG: Ldh family oxidoreductase [Acetobacterales bacterium]
MKQVTSNALWRLIAEIFKGVGSKQEEAEIVADHLVTANLVGHDSHGVIRTLPYVAAVLDDRVVPNSHARLAADFAAVSIFDGEAGFGQVVAREAMAAAIERSEKFGVAMTALRNAGHVGRLGAYPEQAAEAGKMSIVMANSPKLGGGEIAPFGGTRSTLGAGPIAMGAPRKGHHPMILDISTASVAMGKVRVARNKGEKLPIKCIVTKDGSFTDDPNAVYDDRHGSVVPFGAHKGSGLNIFTDIFAGLLSDGGTKKPGEPDRIAQSKNNLFAIVIDPATFGDVEHIQQEFAQFVDFVADADPIPGQEVLMPGDMEVRLKKQRLQDGLKLDDNTWDQVLQAAEKAGIDRESAERLSQ